MVRRNSKQFVRNVIIASVTGLVALMIILFMMLQSFFGDNQSVTSTMQPQETDIVNSKVELSETLLILVHNITEKSIDGYDIKNNKSVMKYLSDTTRISDAYGNVIPISEIKVGDVIEAECNQENERVFSVNKSAAIQSWKKINGVTVDTEGKTVSVGGTGYKYTTNTLILDDEGNTESINNIGAYDIVTVQVYDSTVWSLIVNESSASISIQDLPISKGTIEIDNARLINFSDITEPIKVIPGKHKLVIRMEGYELISKELTVASGELYEISLAEAKKAYTVVQVIMYTNIKDYQVQIGEKTYQPREEIKLEQGKYTVTITAEGYETWTKNILLTNKTYDLRVTMAAIEEEENTEEQGAPGTGSTALSESRTVTLITDPSGANVYIDGAMSGQTPYVVTLANGSHTVLFEKAGYTIYSTSIQIDASNDQSTYLYVLTEN